MFMKPGDILKLGLILGVLQPLVSQADDLFQLSWRGVSYSTGPNGQVVTKPVSERDFIEKVASDNSLDPRQLVFVYRPDKHDTAVVMASTGAFVADVIQMEYNYTEVTNSTDTQIVRQAFLYDEAHTSALGSAFGTERAKRDVNGNLVSDSFHGTFQYSIPETGVVYSGTFTSGRRIKDTSGG
jgi:hypothetical protein